MIGTKDNFQAPWVGLSEDDYYLKIISQIRFIDFCDNCGCRIFSDDDYIKDGRHIYCSKECFEQANNEEGDCENDE